ncbi:1-phosphofructokinase family hexose kinase [Nakamurella sp. UYEF19]|uniref:1-phosphofructokinase family hexose kinase n=1 Tax=Nakamurella sp. UYEF19 TaxID=1756392 RepID=UPI0033973370
MLIATPNLCLDITVRLPHLVPGAIARATATDTSAGGKGVNVARAATALGAGPLLTGFLPTGDGSRLEQLLHHESIAFRTVPVDGVLRVATILLEDDGRVTVINGRGAQIDSAQWANFLELIAGEAPTAQVLVCSGSLPPGLPTDAYRQLVEIGHRAGIPVIVDAAPQVLEQALAAGPDLVSPNLSEAEGLLLGRTDGYIPRRSARPEQVDEQGEDIPARAVRAAAALHAAGATRGVVTAGASGAALATRDGLWWLPAQPVQVVNPIGAGDCFAAGAALAMVSGANDVDIVRRGMATASASCETATAGRLDPVRANALFQAIQAERVGSTVDAR